MATTPAYFQQNPDVAAAYENRFNDPNLASVAYMTPQQFADTHFALYGQAEQRAAPTAAAAVTPVTVPISTGPTTVTPLPSPARTLPAPLTTPASTPAPPALPTYFTQNPDVAAAYANRFNDPNLASTVNMTPQQFADAHYAKFGINEQRISPTGAPAIIPTTTVTKPVTTTTPVVNRTTTGSSLPYFQLNPDVAAAYLTNSYGMTPEQFAAAHYAKYGQFEQRISPSTSPFANATQGFAQNFQNYQSIPIGAQYNPNVVGGTGSPYSQIMSQMRPAGPYNAYMGVASNTPMGGYDPALYERIAQSNAVANLAAGTAPESTVQQESTGLAKGGMVDGGLMFGMNPPGPDDGAVNLDLGEYVIKKSSVNKYGKGLLDMINEGKVPAKKLKSLLG